MSGKKVLRNIVCGKMAHLDVIMVNALLHQLGNEPVAGTGSTVVGIPFLPFPPPCQ